jgi:hypothetical protein
VVTGMFITSDCSRLISVAGDSCVFVWRMPPNLVRCLLLTRRKTSAWGCASYHETETLSRSLMLLLRAWS